jgi:hypothetical protein
MFGFSKPTQKQVEWQNIVKIHKQMTAFRDTLLETGTAKQLAEFDVMYNSMRESIPEDLRWALDKRLF